VVDETPRHIKVVGLSLPLSLATVIENGPVSVDGNQ